MIWLKNIQNILINNKGLTLLELLAVILILGILAAIIVPVVTGQGESARISAHENNIESIEKAAEQYDFELTLQDDDFVVLTNDHNLVLEGYLSEIPENPWSDTNVEHSTFEYILSKDIRGVVFAYLAEVNPERVERIVEREDEGAIVVSTATFGNEEEMIEQVYFMATDMGVEARFDEFNEVMSAFYLNYRFFYDGELPDGMGGGGGELN